MSYIPTTNVSGAAAGTGLPFNNTATNGQVNNTATNSPFQTGVNNGVQVNFIFEDQPSPIGGNRQWGGKHHNQPRAGFDNGYGNNAGSFAPRALYPARQARQWQSPYGQAGANGVQPYQPRPHVPANPYGAQPAPQGAAPEAWQAPFPTPDSEGAGKHCGSHGHGRGHGHCHGRGDGDGDGGGFGGYGGYGGYGGDVGGVGSGFGGGCHGNGEPAAPQDYFGNPYGGQVNPYGEQGNPFSVLGNGYGAQAAPGPRCLRATPPGPTDLPTQQNDVVGLGAQPHLTDGQPLTDDVAQSIASANPAVWKYDPTAKKLLNTVDGWSANTGPNANLPAGWADWINSYDTAQQGALQQLGWQHVPGGTLDKNTAYAIAANNSDYLLADDASVPGKQILFNRRTHEAIPVQGQQLTAGDLDRLNGTLDPMLLARDTVMDRQGGYQLANAHPNLMVVAGTNGQPDMLYNKYTHDAIPLDGHRVTQADFANLYAIPATAGFMNAFQGRARAVPGYYQPA